MTKRVLDEETRKALLGYVPFSVDSRTTFTPEEFNSVKDETLRPVFEVRSLNQGELQQLKKNAQGINKDISAEELSKIADRNMFLIRACVVGWTNLFDSGSGEEVEFTASPTGGCEENLFKRLPVWIVRSIMEFVKKISGLSASEDLSLK